MVMSIQMGEGLKFRVFTPLPDKVFPDKTLQLTFIT